MNRLPILLLALASSNSNATCTDFYLAIASCQSYLNEKPERRIDFEGRSCKLSEQAGEFDQKSDVASGRVKELNHEVANSLYGILLHTSIHSGRMSVENKHVLPLIELAKNGDIEAQFCSSVLFEFGLGYEKNLPMAYALASAAVSQNPPFGEERQDQIAAQLSWQEQSMAVDYANRITKLMTDLYKNPSVVLIK